MTPKRQKPIHEELKALLPRLTDEALQAAGYPDIMQYSLTEIASKIETLNDAEWVVNAGVHNG